MEDINEDQIVISKKEYDQLKKELISFSDYQRLSSLLIWFGIAMVILHIAADVFFHIG